MEEDFEYVVERKKQDAICFGSLVPRSTAPIGKGLSPFQKRNTTEINTSTAPGYRQYDDSMAIRIRNRVTSSKGTSTLASNVPRFQQRIDFVTPSPNEYAPSLHWPVQQEGRFPFGSEVEREAFKFDNYPGPGIYDRAARKCRHTRFDYNFGWPRMVDTIEMFCTSIPTDTCHKCKKLCEGDYWHRDYMIYLCHSCWLEERYTAEIYTYQQLKKFQKIRNCSFIHRHEGTEAKILILPKNTVKKKIRLENYLDLYIKC